MSETANIDTYLYALFTGDATLANLIGTRVYTQLAPPFPDMPCIVFSYLPGAQANRALSDAVSSIRALYEIKAVGQGNDLIALQPIADRIDALISGLAADQTTFRLNFAKQSPVERADVLMGTTRFSHLGAVYRIWYRPKA